MNDLSLKSSQPISLSPPRGMRDFYPEDMALRNKIFDSWRKAAKIFGFSEYDACVVESLDLIKRKAGEEISEQIYSFTDKSGRELALRPEMTPTLARMITARQNSIPMPIKWTTIAQCFRYERMTRGRKREHYQWNLDIIGEPSPLAEAEILSAAYYALANLGLGPSDITVKFSSRSLLSDLLSLKNIPKNFHHAVFLALDKKNKIPENAIYEMLEKAGLSNSQIDDIFRLSSINSISGAESEAGSKLESLENIKIFNEYMVNEGLGEAIKLDLSVIRGLSYYTGIVFEGFYTAGNMRAVFGGGRYDNLLETLGGRPTTGVGLGFGDVVISEILAERKEIEEKPERPNLAIGYMTMDQQKTAIRIARSFRENGTSVDLSLTPEKAKSFFSRASKNGVDRALFIGPDDVNRGTCRIKDMQTGAETDFTIPE